MILRHILVVAGLLYSVEGMVCDMMSGPSCAFMNGLSRRSPSKALVTEMNQARVEAFDRSALFGGDEAAVFLLVDGKMVVLKSIGEEARAAVEAIRNLLERDLAEGDEGTAVGGADGTGGEDSAADSAADQAAHEENADEEPSDVVMKKLVNLWREVDARVRAQGATGLGREQGELGDEKKAEVGAPKLEEQAGKRPAGAAGAKARGRTEKAIKKNKQEQEKKEKKEIHDLAEATRKRKWEEGLDKRTAEKLAEIRATWGTGPAARAMQALDLMMEGPGGLAWGEADPPREEEVGETAKTAKKEGAAPRRDDSDPESPGGPGAQRDGVHSAPSNAPRSGAGKFDEEDEDEEVDDIFDVDDGTDA